MPEVVSGVVLLKNLLLKTYKIHRKTPVCIRVSFLVKLEAYKDITFYFIDKT